MATNTTEKARAGMGAMPHKSGVAFRVWAPHAEAVCVAGSFNDWSADAHLMAREGGGYWYANIASASFAEAVQKLDHLLRLGVSWNGRDRTLQRARVFAGQALGHLSSPFRAIECSERQFR